MPLDLIEEAKYKELRDKCEELKVPAPPEIYIGLQVHDANGILTFDDIQRGHSWTRNFYNSMFSETAWAEATTNSSFGAGYMSGKTTDAYMSYWPANYRVGGNPDASYGRDTHYYNYTNNSSTASSFGIVVGTSDTAFSAEHYTLGAIISHGTGSGQFSYTAMASKVPTYTSGTKTWKKTWTRVFNNNSGASITVKETGLVALKNSGDGANYFLEERSVLSPTVAVANGAQLTVTYEISMSFSAID